MAPLPRAQLSPVLHDPIVTVLQRPLTAPLMAACAPAPASQRTRFLQAGN